MNSNFKNLLLFQYKRMRIVIVILIFCIFLYTGINILEAGSLNLSEEAFTNNSIFVLIMANVYLIFSLRLFLDYSSTKIDNIHNLVKSKAQYFISAMIVTYVIPIIICVLTLIYISVYDQITSLERATMVTIMINKLIISGVLILAMVSTSNVRRIVVWAVILLFIDTIINANTVFYSELGYNLKVYFGVYNPSRISQLNNGGFRNMIDFIQSNVNSLINLSGITKYIITLMILSLISVIATQFIKYKEQSHNFKLLDKLNLNILIIFIVFTIASFFQPLIRVNDLAITIKIGSVELYYSLVVVLASIIILLILVIVIEGYNLKLLVKTAFIYTICIILTYSLVFYSHNVNLNNHKYINTVTIDEEIFYFHVETELIDKLYHDVKEQSSSAMFDSFYNEYDVFNSDKDSHLITFSNSNNKSENGYGNKYKFVVDASVVNKTLNLLNKNVIAKSVNSFIQIENTDSSEKITYKSSNNEIQVNANELYETRNSNYFSRQDNINNDYVTKSVTSVDNIRLEELLFWNIEELERYDNSLSKCNIASSLYTSSDMNQLIYYNIPILNCSEYVLELSK